MRVALIEDDPLKCHAIKEFFNQASRVSNLETFRSFNSGLRGVLAGDFSLVIMDMTLPTFDRDMGVREGRLRPLGGYELIRRFSKRAIDLKVIVVTQLETFDDDAVSLEEITAKCTESFGSIFVGSVYYKQGSDKWKKELDRLIREI